MLPAFTSTKRQSIQNSVTTEETETMKEEGVLEKLTHLQCVGKIKRTVSTQDAGHLDSPLLLGNGRP